MVIQGKNQYPVYFNGFDILMTTFEFVNRFLVLYMSCTSWDFVQVITCTKSCTSYNLFC